MKLIAKKFQVLNYRNIDDSGWIPLERVTAFVGRNESGKTALLKALHKFNPAIEEPYNAQREFPRDRFTAEYRDDENWPVCRVKFELSDEFREELGDLLNGAEVPQKAVLTRSYDGRLEIKYDTEVPDAPVDPEELTKALDVLAKGARRLAAPSEDQEGDPAELRTTLAHWADGMKDAVGDTTGFAEGRRASSCWAMYVKKRMNTHSRRRRIWLKFFLGRSRSCAAGQIRRQS